MQLIDFERVISVLRNLMDRIHKLSKCYKREKYYEENSHRAITKHSQKNIC